MVGEVGVFGGGEDGMVAEDLLNFQQIDARLDQVSGVGVAKAMGRDLFFIPQPFATLRKVV